MKKLIALLLIFASLSAGAEGVSFRALCAGVANYDDGRSRTGGHNSTLGVQDAFSFSHPDGDFTLLLDPSKEELLASIKRELNGSAGLNVLYINCHGGRQGDISWLECSDGGTITAQELLIALKDTQGPVLLIIDCCNSGGFIGSGSFADEFSNGILRAFGNNSHEGLNLFSSSQFYVCVSASYDQNSYRIASGSADEGNMSTVFSRTLCEALGWDLINDRATTLKADMDGDREVSFTEMCLYTRQKCMYYLSFSSPARQTVQFSPLSGELILAGAAKLSIYGEEEP